MNYNKRNLLNRMNSLRSNPGFVAYAFNGKDRYFSNCHGAVAHILEVEEVLRKMAKRPQDFVLDEGKIANINRDLMKRFLYTECDLIKEDYKAGDIVAMWDMIHRATSPGMSNLEALKMPPVRTIEHSAVLAYPKTERIFHAPDTGELLEFTTISEYISKWFPKFRKRGVNLFVDFYRVR